MIERVLDNSWIISRQFSTPLPSFFGQTAVYGILVPWQGSNLGPPAVEAQSPRPWTAREFPDFLVVTKAL